jgi:hypothetical protein
MVGFGGSVLVVGGGWFVLQNSEEETRNETKPMRMVGYKKEMAKTDFKVMCGLKHMESIYAPIRDERRIVSIIQPNLD